MQPIPTLTTERLLLRAPRVDDFPAFARLLASPRARYLGGPHTQREAWGAFCHDVACWHWFGHGGLMVDLRATGESVGQVRINDGPLFPEKELGWQLYAGHEGRGYATEAAMALRDWALRTLQLDGLVSYVHPENHRSVAVAERLGATRDPHAPKSKPDNLVFRYFPTRPPA